MISVFIADDHYIVRKGLIKILSDETDIKVVGEASNSYETINLLKSIDCDILILDISMPGKNGINSIQQIKNVNSKVKILIFSIYNEDKYVLSAFHKGASGYINKDSIAEEMVNAIKLILKGKKFLGSTINKNILNELGDDTIVTYNDTTTGGYTSP
jgi:two-component system, NarL family, invasion response regulator UvrY